MYVEVPPDQVAVNVITVPVFCVDGSDGDGESDGIPRALLGVILLFELLLALPRVFIIDMPREELTYAYAPVGEKAACK